MTIEVTRTPYNFFFSGPGRGLWQVLFRGLLHRALRLQQRRERLLPHLLLAGNFFLLKFDFK